jgi:hypothetical protein
LRDRASAENKVVGMELLWGVWGEVVMQNRFDVKVMLREKLTRTNCDLNWMIEDEW